MKNEFPRSVLPALAAALLAGPALAQSGEGEKPVDEEHTLTEQFFEQRDLQQEMRELFLKVEENLIQVDDLLADAGAGEGSLGAVGDAGLDDLLRSSHEKSKSVVSDIDRILDLVQQMGGT